eukprot:COSAG01_NODE_29754_length_630_cov_1.192090_2_plen_168_part_00
MAAEHVGEVDADGLPDPAGARVVAGACTEIYLNSSVGLLTYLVTSPEARGRGLARRLCDEVLQLVHRRAPLQELSLVVLECHRSGVPDAVMAAHARLAAYERLGWWGFDQLPFVAPAVSEGMSTLVRNAAIYSPDARRWLKVLVPRAGGPYGTTCSWVVHEVDSGGE